VLVARFGSLAVITATGPDGTASPVVDTGDTVTAMYKVTTSVTERHVMTWVGVEPGDHLTLGVPARSSGTVLGEMTVTTPGGFEGATSYHASSGCEAADATEPTPLVYTLFAGCHADPTHVPVWLEARAADGHTLAYAARGDTAVVAEAASATFDAWRTDLVPFASHIDHLPRGAGPVNRHLGLLAPGGELFDVPVVSAVPASASAQVPVGLAPSWIYADQLLEGDGSQSRWRVVAGAAPIPMSLGFDYTSGLLAPLASLGVDGFDPTTLFTSWSFQAGASGSTLDDAVLLTYHLSGGGATGTWSMVLGPGATQARLPPVPAELSEFLPTQLPDTVDVVVIESNNADYKQLRPVFDGTAPDGARLWPLVTSPLRAGTVRISERLFVPTP
jgi:hypothetical protein